jgi:AcrR family transcriptional regulator
MVTSCHIRTDLYGYLQAVLERELQSEKRQQRHQVIAAAAYALLLRNGYAGTSMLSIAKAANASNETLYRWYGDKRGLFEALVRDNAAETKAALEQAIAQQQDPAQALAAIAPVLLRMILSDRAVQLNRAAACDQSGELGAAIAAGGRGTVMPLIEAVIARLTPQPAVALAESFAALLLGPHQIARLIGVAAQPSEAQIAAQCQIGLQAFFALTRP